MLPDKVFRIEEPELFFRNGNMYRLGGAELAVQIDARGLVTADGQFFGAEVANQLRQFPVAAVFVSADNAGTCKRDTFLTTSTSSRPSQGSASGTGLKPPP